MTIMTITVSRVRRRRCHQVIIITNVTSKTMITMMTNMMIMIIMITARMMLCNDYVNCYDSDDDQGCNQDVGVSDGGHPWEYKELL